MRRRRCQASCSRATSPWSMRSPSRPPTKSKNTSSNSNCCKSWAARRPEGRPGMSPHDDPLAQDPLLRELAELQQRHWPAAIAPQPPHPFPELSPLEKHPPPPPAPPPEPPAAPRPRPHRAQPRLSVRRACAERVPAPLGRAPAAKGGRDLLRPDHHLRAARR